MTIPCTIPDHEQQIGGDGNLYAREDKTLEWEIRTGPGGARVDITGWGTLFVVKRRDNASDTVISLAGTIVGTYNATENLNTQVVQVILTDDHLDIDAPFIYRYSLKRVDDGSFDILRAGPFVVEAATQ